METVNDVSLVIRDLAYDRCEKEDQIGTGCDKSCVACHERVFDSLATRLSDALTNDARQIGMEPQGDGMATVIGQVRDWPYAQCDMAQQLFGDDYFESCGDDCLACHRIICEEMANMTIHAWEEAFDMTDETGHGKDAEQESQGILIDGRPDARERLGYVVAWERDVDGLTVRDPRDVASARFDVVAAFPSYEEARTFIDLVKKEHGSGQGWFDAVRRR